MANVLDWYIVVSEFELQSYYSVYFQTSAKLVWNPLLPQLLFFNKDGFGIKYPMKVDMLSNKETKSWLSI